MKFLKIVFLLFPSFALAAGIGFEAYNPPPYPSAPPMYPPLPYPAEPPPAYTPSDFTPITSCSISPGTYRFDAYSQVVADNIRVDKIVVYLTVNDAGLMSLRLKLKPKRGREEQYLVIPYRNYSDLSNVCSGVNFNFRFDRISVYGKTLSGYISGHMTSSGSRGNVHLSVDGLLERRDTSSWNSTATISLSNQKFEYVYSYMK